MARALEFDSPNFFSVNPWSRSPETRGVIKWKGEAGISTLASVIKSAIYSAHTNLVKDARVGDFHKSGRGSKN